MLFRETLTVYSHTKHIIILCGQNSGSLMSKQVVYIVTTGFKNVSEAAVPFNYVSLYLQEVPLLTRATFGKKT
jgi:hypothetical protein